MKDASVIAMPCEEGFSPSIIRDYRWGGGCRGLGRSLGESGAKIGRQAVPGRRILRSPPAQGEAPPLPCGRQGFFWPDVGWGGTSVWPGYLFMPTCGVASIGAAQRLKGSRRLLFGPFIRIGIRI